MNNKIIIYGAGEVGERTMHQLKRNGYTIVAFLDKNRRGSIAGTPIYTIEEYLQLKDCNKDVPVMICLSNGTLHKKIAEKLFVNGFRYIVFLPIGYAMPSKKRAKLSRCYNQALEGEIGEIPEYEQYKKLHLNETAKVRKDNETIVAWVGQEILFSEDISTWQGDLSKVYCVNGGVEVNLNGYHWIHNLYQHFDGEDVNYQPYIDVFCSPNNLAKKKEKLIDREDLYRDFERQIRTGVEGFVESATKVIWNPKGYFNLVGGHHRTVFLLHKGFAFCPVKMNIDVYKAWKNEKVYGQVVKYMETEGIETTYVPIPHPCFMDVIAQRENKGKGILYALLEYIGPIRLDGKKVLDISQYEGYFARITKRMCAETVVCYSETLKEKQFVKLIAELLRIKDIEFGLLKELTKDNIFESDIIFAMQNIQMLMETFDLKGYKGKIFIEMCENEKEGVLKSLQEESGISNYQMLYREVIKGELFEIGVCDASIRSYC